MEIIKTSRFMLFYLDDSVVIFSPKDKFKELNLNESVIINHTENTWEKNRDKREINKNTIQGKIVEEFFVDLIEYKNSISDKLKLKYITYDQIRLDNFKKHAPLDGLLFEQGNPYVEEVINKINISVSISKYGKLNRDIINFCTKHKVYLVEIKSSKIPDKIYYDAKRECGNDSNRIRFQKYIVNSLFNKMDLFKYPLFTRNNGTKIHNTKDYLQWVKNNIYFMKGKNDTEILEYEIGESLNLYTRVFIDDKTVGKDGKPIFIGYFLGYALGCEFYNPLTIMNFQSDKSKHAIYATYPISSSKSFEFLFNDDRLW